MKITINTKFDLGEIVFLKTDEEETPYIIISITYDINNSIVYNLKNGCEVSYHFEKEIKSNKYQQILN